MTGCVEYVRRPLVKNKELKAVRDTSKSVASRKENKGKKRSLSVNQKRKNKLFKYSFCVFFFFLFLFVLCFHMIILVIISVFVILYFVFYLYGRFFFYSLCFFLNSSVGFAFCQIGNHWVKILCLYRFRIFVLVISFIDIGGHVTLCNSAWF